MRTVQEKLKSLTPKSVWYFAKQDANFDHSYLAAKVFDSIPNKYIEDIADYFERHVGQYGILPNHRILSVGQMFGLITKSSPYRRGSKYNEENTTKVFDKLNSFQMGSIDYNRLKTQQLLKVRMQTVTDSREDLKDYCVSPLIFTLEVLYKLQKAGINYISMDNFYTYVMTSKSQAEVNEVVYWLKNNPLPSRLVSGYMDDSRIMHVLRENVDALDFSTTTIRLNPAFQGVVASMFDGLLKSDVEKVLRILNSRNMYPQSLTIPMNIDIVLVK
jgi:hypothetical protein